MPSTALKDNLQRVMRSAAVMHGLSSAGSHVRAAGRAMARRTDWMLPAFAAPRRTWALTSSLLHRSGDHVSMNRRALLVCLALYACSHAYADNTPGVDSPEVQSLIEALRPLPITRGIDPHPKLASAALTIEFEPGSVRLTEQGRRSLDTLGAALGSGELEQYPFRIEVHVETGASASHDQLLSKRQANAIKDYLVKQYQLSPRRLATDGRGSAQPIKQTNPASPVNRRVVVVNTSSSEE
jgi:outer membrane protein OmpA-like peptidoglycan-associated protein